MEIILKNIAIFELKCIKKVKKVGVKKLLLNIKFYLVFSTYKWHKCENNQ